MTPIPANVSPFNLLEIYSIQELHQFNIDLNTIFFMLLTTKLE
jgi:hypothetical protein